MAIQSSAQQDRQSGQKQAMSRWGGSSLLGPLETCRALGQDGTPVNSGAQDPMGMEWPAAARVLSPQHHVMPLRSCTAWHTVGACQERWAWSRPYGQEDVQPQGGQQQPQGLLPCAHHHPLQQVILKQRVMGISQDLPSLGPGVALMVPQSPDSLFLLLSVPFSARAGQAEEVEP